MATESEADNGPLRYEIRLLIKHPDIDPDSITSALGIEPHVSWRAGAPRKTPTGGNLPGVYRETAWSFSYRVEGSRRFSIDIEKTLERLVPHRQFLLGIVESQGQVTLIVNLPGDINIGSVLTLDALSKISELKIRFGVEVFPEFT